MTVMQDLERVSAGLRRTTFARWANDDILKHIEVRLPAPIFDKVVAELRLELQPASSVLGFALGGAGDHFTFGGIKYARVDGRYWSASDLASSAGT